MCRKIYFVSCFSFLLACTSTADNNEVHTCPCDLLSQGNAYLHIRKDTKVLESNSDHTSIEDGQYIYVEGDINAKMARIPNLSGSAKVLFPIISGRKKYYVQYTIQTDSVADNYQKYFLAYCSKFYDYVDMTTCSINSQYREVFSRKKDELLQLYIPPSNMQEGMVSTYQEEHIVATGPSSLPQLKAHGYVRDQQGNTVSKVGISMDGIKTVTNQIGYFELTFDSERYNPGQRLRVLCTPQIGNSFYTDIYILSSTNDIIVP